ncbi:MAG: peptidoglycan binding domain-containing protein, partial [Bacillota bacterium]
MTEYKDAVETMDIGPRKRGGKNKLFLIISGGVLVVALIVCAVVLLLGAGPGEDTAERVIELGTVMKGVSVNGVDISGMTRDEVLAATSGLEAELFAKANFTVDVNGNVMNFTAQDFALQTDYEAVIDKAMAYGRAGTFEERLAAANAAKESPVDFPVTVTVDETKLKTALTTLKAQLDTAPVDATSTFAAWGYMETQ